MTNLEFSRNFGNCGNYEIANSDNKSCEVVYAPSKCTGDREYMKADTTCENCADY